MSYILEALKKAEAERQLGDTPTIHAAPAVHAAPRAAAGNRKPLLIGLAAGVLLASVAAFVTLRHQASAPATLPAATAQRDAVAVPGAGAPAIVAAPPAPAVVVPPLAVPAPVRESHARASGPARVAAPDALAVRTSVRAPVQADVAAHEVVREAPRGAAPAAAAIPPGADDNVRPLAELPEAIQREVPRVAFGGYIYSPNPSDRLLLVDKALRHEGEQVAPGLVLEKLLPKAAVMNYKGYRYRVAY